jgi:hypothetical protein
MIALSIHASGLAAMALALRNSTLGEERSERLSQLTGVCHVTRHHRT